MATCRSIIIGRTVDKYREMDFEVVDEFVKRLERKLEEIYEDEKLLSGKVEAFIEEAVEEAKRAVKKVIDVSRDEEADSCGRNERDTSMPSDKYENQGRFVARKLEDIFEEIGTMLEKMRSKVENKDRGDSNIPGATQKALAECKDNIEEEYRIDSKKMISELDEVVGEYVQQRTQNR